ncbi:MAG TPA: phosphatase PAP2 family protein [Miltoncostaeaceae bacterium]|nr:phosphatase PAP2 family protein [Miltoncostaeaceae bacterium]
MLAENTRRTHPSGTVERLNAAWLRLSGLLVEIGLVAAFALAYFGIRGLTQGSQDQAFANAHSLVDLERALGILWEEGVQGAIVDHPRLVTLANWIYIYGHWPVIVTAMVVLYLRCPPHYVRLRNAVFLSGVIGMAFFALLPMAPPRLGVLDVVDSVSERSQGYRALQPPSLTNPYAAMPSLHMGWNLLVGLVLWQATRRATLRVVAVAMPVAMAWAVVATANHYVLDVVVGVLVAVMGYVLALVLAPVMPRAGRLRRAGH